MKYIFTFLFLVLYFVQGVAQAGIISGKVTSTNGNKLEFINVLVKGTFNGTSTDVEGKFTLEDVPVGQQTLVISGVGYGNIEKSVQVEAGKTTTVEVTLQEAISELQSVEIIGRRDRSYQNRASYGATKTATPIKDIPQAISYVTKELIADRQAYRVNDIVENISGINQFSYYNDYTIRGFRSQQELINGLRVIGLFGPQILTANLERVEIIKGPASAVFGNASPGGTMNRVTKKPLDVDRKSVSFTTGSFNTLRATLDFTGPLNKDGSLLYRLNVAHENSDDFRDLQEFKSTMVAPSISFLPSDNTRINFDLVLTRFDGKLDRGQPIFGASAGTDLNSTPINFAIGAANDYHTTDVTYSTLSLNHDFNDKLSFNVSYMRYAYQEDLFEHRTSNRFAVDGSGNEIPTLMGMRISAREQKQISDNVSSYFVWNTKTGDAEHKLLAGYDFLQRISPVGNAGIFTSSSAIYRTQNGGLSNYDPASQDQFILDARGNPVPNIPHFNLENPNYLLGYPSDYILGRFEIVPSRFYSNGLYIQDQIKWNRLQLLIGARMEYYTDVINYKQADEETIQQEKFLPRIGLVYGINKAINVYGTYTESFQPQNPTDLAPQNGGPFDPLTGTMVELGAKGTFFNDQLAVNIAVYSIENNNILIPDIATGFLQQRGGEEAQGIEFDINGQINPNLSITANYAFNEAIISASDNEAEVGRIKENAPKHSGGLFINYRLPQSSLLSGFGFNLGANFVTARNTFESALILPGYTVFDAGIAYQINKVRIAANFNNVFNETHWVGGYSYVRLFPGAPRNFLVNIAYTF